MVHNKFFFVLGVVYNSFLVFVVMGVVFIFCNISMWGVVLYMGISGDGYKIFWGLY